MQEKVGTIRNNGLDILKCMCAFMIVCIHSPFPGEFGKYIVGVSRIAVPIFFMITGFYYKEIVKKNKEESQIKKIIKIMIISNLIYLVLDFIKYTLSGELSTFLIKVCSFKSLINFIAFNESPFYLHLWYIGALLYVLIVFKLLKIDNNYKIIKILYFIVPILLLFDLILGKYSMLFIKKEIDYIYIRNFIFVGIPYFSIGYFLSNIKIKNNNKVFCFLCILIFIMTTILERKLLVDYGLNTTRDHYISTTFLAISTFIFFYNLNWNSVFLSKIGRVHSTNIYIIHPIIIFMLSKFFKMFEFYKIYSYAAPGIVFLGALIISYVVIYLKKNDI